MAPNKTKAKAKARPKATTKVKTEAKAKSKAKLEQLKAAFTKADQLSDRDDNEEALTALDDVLGPFAFTPTVEMSLADDLIEQVGECFRLRGTVAVLGPPYARKTALADSERDFRTAIAWHSLGMSSPDYAWIGLCETLAYEAGAYARAIAEATRALATKPDAYAKFFVTKAKAFAQLGGGDAAAGKTTYAAAIKLAGDDARFNEELGEDFDRVAKDFPKHAKVVAALRAKL